MDTQAVEPSADALAAMERFVVENDDLLELEAAIGRFNVFDALGVARREINHSNFLAFILDPAESHGQGQLFLKALLMDLLKVAPQAARPLSPIELDGTELRGVEIRREWNHIDLLITCQQPPFAIVIENKVDSREHSDQLRRYAESMRTHYPDLRPLYVFLTPGADDPSESAWVPYSYADIHRVLKRVRTTYANAIGDDVLIFLDHYLTLIGTRFMDNPTIDELCRCIYKNHRQALTLIFERAGTSATSLLGELRDMLRDDPRWKIVREATGFIDFVPVAWLNWLPPVGNEFEDRRAWIVFRLDVSRQQLDYYVQVGLMEDTGKRRQIIDVLLAEGESIGFKRRSNVTVTDRYTRVSSREKLVGWKDGDEPDAADVISAARKKLNAVHARVIAIPEAVKASILRIASSLA